MQLKTALALLLVALSALVTVNAAATTVVALDFDELVEASDAVVVADVQSVTAQLDKGRVYTHVELAVVETLKGQTDATIKIIHIGGRTEKLATFVAGMPDFVQGERTLLFLEKPEGYPHYVVTGLTQGKIDLRKSDEDGEWYVKPRVDSLRTVKPIKLPSGDVTLKPTRVAPIRKVSLSDLRERVASHTKTLPEAKTPAPPQTPTPDATPQ